MSECHLAPNSPSELLVSFEGKIKTPGANFDQEGRRESLGLERSRCVRRGGAPRVPGRGEAGKEDSEHIYSHLAPLISQTLRLPERSPKCGEQGGEEFVWAEDLECFMLSTYVFWKCLISLTRLFIFLEMEESGTRRQREGHSPCSSPARFPKKQEKMQFVGGSMGNAAFLVCLYHLESCRF